jgi:hypothetical protein
MEGRGENNRYHKRGEATQIVAYDFRKACREYNQSKKVEQGKITF